MIDWIFCTQIPVKKLRELSPLGSNRYWTKKYSRKVNRRFSTDFV